MARQFIHTFVFICFSFVSACFTLAQTPENPPVDNGARQAGRATREVENWTTDFQQSRQQVAAVREQIFEQVPAAMFGSAERLAAELQVHRQHPNKESRRHLQQTTVNELQAIKTTLAPINAQRETVMSTVTGMEMAIRARGKELRGEVEQLDAALPERASKLEKLREENDRLKEQFLSDPGNRELELDLRQRFFQERKVKGELSRDERLRNLKSQAAEAMQGKAAEVQALHDSMMDTFVNLQLAQGECEQMAEVLSRQIALEEELDAVSGGMEITEVMKAAEESWQASSKLTEQLETVLGLLTGIEEPRAGNPQPIPQTEFQNWLDLRKN